MEESIKMLAAERKNFIMEQITKNKIVKVVELSQKLNTTEVTIRRDLEELQNQKKVHRVYGGAIAVSSAAKLDSKTELLVRCIEEKKKIALTAYDYVDDQDAIILDASTTVLELAKLISKGEKRNISVITNSFDVVSVFLQASQRPDLNVFHTGGQLLSNMNSGIGTITMSTLENIRADKCFLGVNGIHVDFGYSCPAFEDAAVKKCMLKSAKQRFILADHTKMSEMYMGKFADISGDIDYLIMDKAPGKNEQDFLSKCTNLILSE